MVRFARLPLSPYQRDIWVAAAQFPELDQYTIFSYDRFTGEVDTQALERALRQAARDTEAFRLRLGETDGTPHQWLDTDADFDVRQVDLRADRDPEAAVRSWLRDAFRHAYPLDGRSLVDLALLHSDQALYVYVRTHHIVSDAWGLQLFLSRVRAGYLGELGEPQAQMPTASLLAQLGTDDYSGSEQYRGDRAYFAEALEGLEPALFTRRRPAGLRRTARHRLTLERALLDAIRDRGESPFLFLSAAVALYLARIHQNDDVVLGVPVLNRADRAAKQVVGHFANTLPLRIRTAPEQTIDEFLAQLREATRTLLRHQKMPSATCCAAPRHCSTPPFPTCAGPPPRRSRTPASRPWRRPTPMTRTRWPSGSPSSTGTATRRWISNTPAMCSTPTSPWTPRRGISKPSCAPWWRAASAASANSIRCRPPSARN